MAQASKMMRVFHILVIMKGVNTLIRTLNHSVALLKDFRFNFDKLSHSESIPISVLKKRKMLTYYLEKISTEFLFIADILMIYIKKQQH